MLQVLLSLVVAVGALVNMKKASGRPQDLADVEALEKLP